MEQRIVTLVLSLPLAAACGGSAPKPVVDAPSRSPHGQAASPGAAADPARTAGPLAFKAPAGWIEEAPSNPMRLKQYALPAAEGDSQNASLVVFTGIGGTADMNITRWIGQFQQPDGSDSAAKAVRSTRAQGDLTIHEVEIVGNFVAEMPPGSGAWQNEANWRMLGAVVETPHGPYHVKLVGPDATVSRWKESFREFLASSMQP